MKSIETVLGYVFWIIVIIIFFRYKTNKKKNNNIQKGKMQDIQTNNSEEEYNNQINIEAYEKKKYLLTSKELSFYKILKQITDNLKLNVFCQVALYEVIKCKDYKEFNRIKSKSIDFVITKQNCEILLCIELDDSTHNQLKRTERDNFINTIFDASNTKLLRIPTQSYYNIDEIEILIKNNIDFKEEI